MSTLTIPTPAAVKARPLPYCQDRQVAAGVTFTPAR